MADISHLLFGASRASEAGHELWSLYNTLADEYEGDDLLGRFDAYVCDLSPEAQRLYQELYNQVKSSNI